MRCKRLAFLSLKSIFWGVIRGSRGKTKRRNPFHIKGLRRFSNHSAGIGIYPFLRWKSQYTPAVKREHLRFILKGFLPFLITGWIGGSELGYTKEFLGAACYFAGFSSIFFRRYIRVLLRDLSKMPNYSCSEYQLQLFHNINQGYIKFILLTSYFFLTGTLILLYLP